MNQDLFGEIKNPFQTGEFDASVYSSVTTGLPKLLSVGLTMIAVIAGIYTLILIVLAGFEYITAGGEPEKIQKAWQKITQSLVGLLIIASAFAISAIIGLIFFGDVGFVFKPIIYGPGTL